MLEQGPKARELEQKYRPLAGWVRNLVNVKHLYLKRSCQGYYVGKMSLLVCFGWWLRWYCPGMVLHSSWFTEKDSSEQLFT